MSKSSITKPFRVKVGKFACWADFSARFFRAKSKSNLIFFCLASTKMVNFSKKPCRADFSARFRLKMKGVESLLLGSLKSKLGKLYVGQFFPLDFLSK